MLLWFNYVFSIIGIMEVEKMMDPWEFQRFERELEVRERFSGVKGEKEEKENKKIKNKWYNKRCTNCVSD